MRVTRRRGMALAIAAGVGGVPAGSTRAQASRKLRLGIIGDLSGPYAENSLPSEPCARQALEDFGVAAKGWDVDILVGDHQNKADVAAALARRWFDQDGVDALLDVSTSATALACATIVREKNKVALFSGPGTTELTGSQCGPNHVHWSWDTYMLAHTSGKALTAQGFKTWFLIAPDYTFGRALATESTNAVVQNGGEIKGSVFYPFPSTSDFAPLLIQAQASGARVLGLCSGGADTVSIIKQVQEFGLDKTMKVISLLVYDSDIRAMGLETAQGLLAAETFYWDLNDRTRAFMARIRPKLGRLIPNQANAGIYSSTLHYLKAVESMGLPAAKADGAAVVARMKAIPTDDDAFGPGRIRLDGRKLEPAYLMQVKTPAESKGRDDVFKVLATIPAEEAFRPMEEGGCPLVPR